MAVPTQGRRDVIYERPLPARVIFWDWTAGKHSQPVTVIGEAMHYCRVIPRQTKEREVMAFKPGVP